MSERYTKVFSLEKNLYIDGSPVIIKAGALLHDHKTQRILVQLKLQSISPNIIKATTVQIVAKDIAGRELEGVKVFQYLDLNARRDDEFGEQTPIYLDIPVARAFSVCVTEVVMNDNMIWSADAKEWTVLPLAQPLRSIMGSDLLEQYQIDNGADCKTTPTQIRDLWYCACGACNHLAEQHCHVCNRLRDYYLREIDIQLLRDEFNQRTEAEREKAEEEHAKRLEAAKKRKKRIAILAASAATVILVGVLVTKVIVPSCQYQNAVELYEEGEYEEAIAAFEKLNGYKDSVDKMLEVKYAEAEAMLEQGQSISAAILFEELGDYQDAKAMSIIARQQAASVISAGFRHTVAVKADGTVMAAGLNNYNQCEVSNWEDIVSVSAGYFDTVGLKESGKVVYLGINDGDVELNRVSDWEGIIAVSAGWWHTVGLKSDGTVVAVGSNEEGQCNVSKWKNIIAVSAGNNYTVGLTADGTVVAVGESDEGQCAVSNWKDITLVSAGSEHTVGLKSDGTVVATGENDDGECEVKAWEDIVALSVGANHTVGLKSDGTVVAVGSNVSGQCEVTAWKDIVAVSAGGWYTIGLKADGTVVAAGSNKFKQCNVSDWTDIKTQ